MGGRRPGGIRAVLFGGAGGGGSRRGRGSARGMGQPSILVIDGNRAATREQQVAAGGQPSGEGYAQVLRSLAAVSCDIVRPADGEVRFASGSGLASYDGVAITGSALNVYDRGAHIGRQIELAPAPFDARVTV